MTAEEVEDKRHKGHDAGAVIEGSPDLKGVLDALGSGVFSPGDANRYRPIIDSLYHGDWFMVAADFDAYAKAQRDVASIWRNDEWGMSWISTFRARQAAAAAAEAAGTPA